MKTDLEIQADIERSIERIMTDCHLPRRTARSENASRRHAIRVLRSALAECIADEVVQGDEPWEGTIAKYKMVVDHYTANDEK
jgi:hypothetical protein